MKRTLTHIAVILLLSGNAFAKNHQVQMLNYKDGESMIFDPGYLKIDPQDHVTFIPSDLGHNSKSLLVPNGSKNWNGKNDQKITIKFDHEGIYIYECSNHSVMAMLGVIQVGKASNLKEAKDFLEHHKKKLAMNKDRLDAFLETLKQSQNIN